MDVGEPAYLSGPHANGRSPMANEVVTTEAPANAVEPKKPDPNRLPQNAAQPKTSGLAKEFNGDLSEQDVGLFERALESHIENPEQVRKHNAYWDYVMCVMNAQREALIGLGKKGTLEEMVGDPVNRTHFRGILKALISTAKVAQVPEVKLLVSVPPNDESLGVLDAALKGGAIILGTQEGIKNPPKFKSIGTGVGKFKTAQHVPELFAAAKARAEKLLSAPKQ